MFSICTRLASETDSSWELMPSAVLQVMEWRWAWASACPGRGPVLALECSLLARAHVREAPEGKQPWPLRRAAAHLTPDVQRGKHLRIARLRQGTQRLWPGPGLAVAQPCLPVDHAHAHAGGCAVDVSEPRGFCFRSWRTSRTRLSPRAVTAQWDLPCHHPVVRLEGHVRLTA